MLRRGALRSSGSRQADLGSAPLPSERPVYAARSTRLKARWSRDSTGPAGRASSAPLAAQAPLQSLFPGSHLRSFCFQFRPSSSEMNTSNLLQKALFLPNRGRQKDFNSQSRSVAGGLHMYLHASEEGKTENPDLICEHDQAPCSHHKCPCHPLLGQLMPVAHQGVEDSSLSFLEGSLISSHLSALDRYFLLSPQKSSFFFSS